MKWSFIDNKNWPHYVVANADESEPGTFKDREIMESNPFQFLEGLALASYAVGANAAYVYLRGEFWQLGAFLDEKIAEMEKDGILGDKLFGGEYSCASILISAPAPISAAKRPPFWRIARRQARPAETRPPAVPAFVWPLWKADHHQQRGDLCKCAVDPCERRGLVQIDGDGGQRRGKGLLTFRACAQTWQL